MTNKVYDIITQKIIDQLEAGVIPWNVIKMSNIETLQAKYKEIDNRIHILAKQKIGKTPYQALRIDNEMDLVREEKYNLHVEIKKQYPVIYSLLIDYSYLNLLQIMDIINVCEHELTYNSKDILQKKYPDIIDLSDIVDKIYYSRL